MRASEPTPHFAVTRSGHVWLSRHWHDRPLMAEHRHSGLECNLVVRGTARCVVAAKRYDLRRHHLLWLFPDQDHRIINPSADFEMWVAALDPWLIREHTDPVIAKAWLQEQPTTLACRPLPPARANILHALFAEAHAATDAATSNAGTLFVLLRAWNDYATSTNVTIGKDMDPRVERAAQVWAVDCRLSVAEVCARIGVEHERLAILFRSQLGLSPVDYRNRLKLEHFLNRYDRGRRATMLSAALAAGFGSYAQFHRVFVQCMGMSPRQFLAADRV